MTAQEVVTEVRASLKDTYDSPYRWSDEFIFRAIDDAQIALSQARPSSLFTETGVPTMQALPLVTALADTLSVNGRFKLNVAAYACYKCLTIDSEDGANIETANVFLQQFSSTL